MTKLSIEEAYKLLESADEPVSGMYDKKDIRLKFEARIKAIKQRRKLRKINKRKSE